MVVNTYIITRLSLNLQKTGATGFRALTMTLLGSWSITVTRADRTEQEHKSTTFRPELSTSAVSFCCIASLQQSPLPYNSKPSDHSHLALTQSLSIYTAQREERVNVGNTVLSVKTENRSVWFMALSCMPSLTTHACVVSTEVNYVSGVWRKGCSRLWAAGCCHNKWCSCVMWELKKPRTHP